MATATKDSGGERRRALVDVAFGHLGLKRARLTADMKPLKGFRQERRSQMQHNTLLNLRTEAGV